jgi:hypothetical protein
MKLTPPTGRGRASGGSTFARTTAPGFRNPNGQVVIAATGARSTARDNQMVYHLRCSKCGYDYSCNGMDIKGRCCPRCQSGVGGEPLREAAPMFDFSGSSAV